MKKNIIVPAILAITILLAPASALARKYPDVTLDGLERVKKSKADAVYVLPEADLSGYNRVIILEPEIAFRKNWQWDMNSSSPANRISNRDMEKMIANGKKLFLDEFTKVLAKKGYAMAEEPDDDVLLVRPSITDLDVKAPDPNNTNSMWTRVYSEEAGEATLTIELFDSVTKQILVRTIDHNDEIGHSFGTPRARTRSTNIMDARQAFASWAVMLANGLDKAKAAKD